MAKYGLLMAAANPPEHAEGEINAWWDAEHIPERLSLPGFLGARRWVASEAPYKYLTLYDLASPDAVRTEEYREVAGDNATEWTKRVLASVPDFSRTVYEQIWPGQARALDDAGALLLVAIDPDPAQEEDLNRWYEEEHLGLLLKVPGWRQARRFRLVEGDAPKYLAIYDLASLDALKRGPELDAARNTPWAERTRPTWQRVVRGSYRPYLSNATDAAEHGQQFESDDKGGVSVTQA